MTLQNDLYKDVVSLNLASTLKRVPAAHGSPLGRAPTFAILTMEDVDDDDDASKPFRCELSMTTSIRLRV